MRIILFLACCILAGWNFTVNFFTSKVPTVSVAAPVHIVSTCDPALTGVEKIVCLAEEFKTTLSASQLATLQLEYNLVNAKKWSNLPVTFVPRLGLRFGDLNSAQLAAAKALIAAATGSTGTEGYEELVQLWAADAYLLNNGGGSAYGAGQYYIAFLGTPSLTGTWELQTGGHHLAVANTYSNGVLTGATPSFRAVEPFDAFAGSAGTYQPMVQERDSLVAMLSSLDASQLSAAKVSTVFNDILLGPGKDWQFPAIKAGLKVSTLTAAQKALVLAAIRTYVQDIDTENAALLMAIYTSGLDDTYIAYSGGSSLTAQRDYVRIDGPRVWIEYSTQNGIVLSPKHPHSVWRDHLSDYGGLGNPSGTQNLDFNGQFTVFPNPVHTSAQVEIGLDAPANITLKVYNSLGVELVKGLSFQMTAGKHTLPLNLKALPNGQYSCVLEVNNQAGQASWATRQIVKQ